MLSLNFSEIDSPLVDLFSKSGYIEQPCEDLMPGHTGVLSSVAALVLLVLAN